MSGITVERYPDDQILTLADFATAHDLTVEIVEMRDGKWFAKIDAYTSATYSNAKQNVIPRQLISTPIVKTQTLAQTGLATLLTQLNTVEFEDGTKVDISGVRVTPGEVDESP